MITSALIRFAYLAVTHAFAAPGLLSMNARDKYSEILALRHQVTVLQGQLSPTRTAFRSEDRAFPTALLTPLPRARPAPTAAPRPPGHRAPPAPRLIKRHHAQTSRPERPGRPRTVRSIRLLILRLVCENPHWGYRRVHGELAALGIKIATSTVREIPDEIFGRRRGAEQGDRGDSGQRKT